MVNLSYYIVGSMQFGTLGFCHTLNAHSAFSCFVLSLTVEMVLDILLQEI